MKIRYFFFLALALFLLPLRLQAATMPPSPANIQLAQEFERGESEGENDEQNYYTAPAAPLDNNTNTAPQNSVSGNSNAALSPVVTPSASSQPQTISAAFPWAWVAARAAGIASYILLAFLTMTGISLSTGLLFRLFEPSVAWSIHRAIGSALLISVMAHVFSLLLDHFINLKLVDVLVPFVSFYKPVLVALGVFGFYLLLLLLGTSLYTMTKHARGWRLIHYFSFLMFTLIFLHGTLLGTDRHQPWMVAMYWVTAVLVGIFVIYRLVWRFRRSTPGELTRSKKISA